MSAVGPKVFTATRTKDELRIAGARPICAVALILVAACMAGNPRMEFGPVEDPRSTASSAGQMPAVDQVRLLCEHITVVYAEDLEQNNRAVGREQSVTACVRATDGDLEFLGAENLASYAECILESTSIAGLVACDLWAQTLIRINIACAHVVHLKYYVRPGHVGLGVPFQSGAEESIRTTAYKECVTELVQACSAECEDKIECIVNAQDWDDLSGCS
jgi:hypothetical protein